MFHILTAIDKQNESEILYFIDKQVNDLNREQQTPLYIGNNLNKIIFIFFSLFYLNKAAEKGHANVVEILIKHGAKREATTNTGATPLFIGIYLNKFNFI